MPVHPEVGQAAPEGCFGARNPCAMRRDVSVSACENKKAVTIDEI
jgi:hypothetical protein